jgi:hypothetical protein
MSRNDLTGFLQYIRFDVRRERAVPLKSDKFAMIFTVWDRFIINSQNCFKPSDFLMIDEQLFPTKTGSIFIQYMSNKT